MKKTNKIILPITIAIAFYALVFYIYTSTSKFSEEVIQKIGVIKEDFVYIIIGLVAFYFLAILAGLFLGWILQKQGVVLENKSGWLIKTFIVAVMFSVCFYLYDLGGVLWGGDLLLGLWLGMEIVKK